MKNLKSVLSIALVLILTLIFNISAFASGNILPETGGMGTTVFYVVGGLLVVGAVIFLIAKRKQSGSDEDEDEE